MQSVLVNSKLITADANRGRWRHISSRLNVVVLFRFTESGVWDDCKGKRPERHTKHEVVRSPGDRANRSSLADRHSTKFEVITLRCPHTSESLAASIFQ